MSCGVEPPQNRDVNELRPDFRTQLIKWMNACNRFLKDGKQVRISETYRSQERQQWLYNHGRVKGCGTPGRFHTWTLDSNHKYRIAADIFIQENGAAIWNPTIYKSLYAQVPPSAFELETLEPLELVHIQLKDATQRRTDWTPDSPASPPPPATANKPVRIFSPSGILLGSGTLVHPDKVYLKDLKLNFKEMEQK